MKTLFRNFIAVCALVILVVVVSNYYPTVGNVVGVKGASTKRVDDIKTRISNDVQNQVDTVASKAGDIKVSDFINGLQRFGRIPKDIDEMKNYTTKQLSQYFSKKKK